MTFAGPPGFRGPRRPLDSWDGASPRERTQRIAAAIRPSRRGPHGRATAMRSSRRGPPCRTPVRGVRTVQGRRAGPGRAPAVPELWMGGLLRRVARPACQSPLRRDRPRGQRGDSDGTGHPLVLRASAGRLTRSGQGAQHMSQQTIAAYEGAPARDGTDDCTAAAGTGCYDGAAADDGASAFPDAGPADGTPGARVQLAVTVLVAGIPFVGLGLALWLAWGRDVGLTDVLLMVGLYVVTGVGVTASFRRDVTHRGFGATPALRGGRATHGTMTFEGGVVAWVPTHRRHHAGTHRPGRPHSP